MIFSRLLSSTGVNSNSRTSTKKIVNRFLINNYYEPNGGGRTDSFSPDCLHVYQGVSQGSGGDAIPPRPWRTAGGGAGPLEEADLESVPLRPLPPLQPLLLQLLPQHETLPVPQLDTHYITLPYITLHYITLHTTLAEPSRQDLPKYMKAKNTTAANTMETQMAGLTQGFQVSVLMVTSSSVSVQVPCRQMI